MKKKIQKDIKPYIQEIPHIDKPIKIGFMWIEKTKRRDYDNIAFAKKFILDAFVKYGKLKDDNRRCVTRFTDSFDYGNETKVILNIREVEG